jgi:GxxExxY protein
MYPHQDLTHKIISAAIEVHKNLGPGLLENVYSFCLGLELEFRGLRFQKELDVPLHYKTRKIDRFLRLDFLVEDEIVLELKSLDTIMPVHEAQLLTYLKLTGKQVGLLINFNIPLLKDGILRRILGSANVDLGARKNLIYTEKTEALSTQRGANVRVPLENSEPLSKKF